MKKIPWDEFYFSEIATGAIAPYAISPIGSGIEQIISVGNFLFESKGLAKYTGGGVEFYAFIDAPIELKNGTILNDGLPSVFATENKAEEDFLFDPEFINLAMAAPTDPLYSSQWHLNTTFGIDVLTAWNDYTGAGIRISDFDQGVDRFHVDLDANYSVALSINAHTNTAGGTPIGSGDNHGTATGGLIAAERNGVGVVGVAYSATLISEYSDLSFGSIASDATNAFNYSAAHADIQSNSWGFGNLFLSSANSAFIDNFKTSAYASDAAAVANAGLNGRGGLGTILVQAAGNTRGYGDDTNLHNFQNNRFTIAVAATLQDGNLTSYSTPGASILVSAPGSPTAGTITTTDRSGSPGYNSGDYTSTFNGTSAATPQVAGVVALMLQANPLLGSRDVQEILAYTAREVGNTGSYAFNGAHNWNGGGLHTSADYGYGLVDATAAVRLAET
jgi:subtilisin family serine protease